MAARGGVMKIVFHTMEEQTIEQFADTHKLTMEVYERSLPIGHKERFYAHFERCEIIDDCVLIGAFGNGRTPEEAIANYATEISMKRIVIDAFSQERREIEVPRLIRTESWVDPIVRRMIKEA
jgi:hypothetical protein